jgi:hypothetical protein
MVPSGKEALAAAAASSAILSTVAAYNKEQDFVFKTYAMECLQVECPQCVHAQSCVCTLSRVWPALAGRAGLCVVCCILCAGMW